MLFLRFAAHCVSLLCLRCSLFGHAFPIYAMPLLTEAKHFVACPFVARPLQSNSSHFEAIPLLNCATQCSSFALPSKPCQSFAKMFQAMQCLCGSARFTARRYFALALLDIAFPLPFHASPSLLFFMPRLAFPLLFSATLLPAYQFPCRSIHCDDVPLHIIALLCQAFADQVMTTLCLCLALPFVALPLRG